MARIFEVDGRSIDDDLGEALPAPGARTDTVDTIRGASRLRRLLVTADAAALVIGWSLPIAAFQFFGGSDRSLLAAAVVVIVGIVAAHVGLTIRGLYTPRNIAVRTIEVARAAISLAVTTLIVFAGLVVFGFDSLLGPVEAIAVYALSTFLVVAMRGIYQNWLTRCRAEGRYTRRVLVLGTNTEAKDLIDLLESNPTYGFTVVGVLGYPGEAAHVGIDVDRLFVGSMENAPVHIAQHRVGGVIAAESAIAPSDRRVVIRRLLRTGVHVHMTGAVRGVDNRRVRTQLLAQEPLLYLEPAVLRRWQLTVKRTLDLAVSLTLLAVLSPFVALGAIAVKLSDRGPVLTRLPRVDRNGRSYRVATIRTTVTRNKMTELGAAGLTKPRPLWSDPYRTPIGRVLEATCLNEVPQLWSVVRGDTSLVGHRPTRPEGLVAISDIEPSPLRAGLTGLWRVEARHSGDDTSDSFLDDFYVENWSVTLDMVILLLTLDKLLARVFYGESWRRQRGSVGQVDLAATDELSHFGDPDLSTVA